MAGPEYVALWYMRSHSPGYELCVDEREAAGCAWAMQDSGSAAPLGVQFSDGRLIDADHWPLLDQVTREYHAADEHRASEPEPPQRNICDPFGGRDLTVAESEPAWLGKPATAEPPRAG